MMQIDEPGIYETQVAAIQFALDTLKPGDHVAVCRGTDASPCEPRDGQPCPMCADITVTEDMTADDVLDLARASRA